ncbi:MAG: SIS domain-containing protein [Cetobacterium somerae]|uniref:Sugar isomerase, AgaS family n=1 Tax=Cetobacterium somerae ATCC BAA-474 TaxID=1319815 RepID=U7VEC5_9FUSO|nr:MULTISPECIES: SIS domain-containing protein [Cetobacterium]ERT69851.1 sugar isomerase, AgaS family [Cetobacterium somerae ATCC BAA-474]MBC2853302.1 SIS domain-containing protein [Cetobacterium sp. 2G large]MCQ9625655.1 SIS domain-containing protein [Cetobacterium somerae]WVJ01469.1 SIS domain-containing protein [Cetobacterium somerae]
MKDFYTLKEIEQQKRLWLETINLVKEKKEEIKSFLDKNDFKNRKIIFTGAGTSEFVGNSITPALGGNVLSIATTDIVSNPENYLKKDEKVILISCARSGNSPESVATVKLADEIIDDVCHILITCNKDGKLAINKKDDKKALVLLMPEESNDKGFAMTSSFTCMSLTGLLIFNLESLEKIEDVMKKQIEKIKDEDMKLLIDSLITLDISRIVYLGSSCLKGVAEEAALKCLELTAGHMSLHYNSPLGFRHGPKSIINDTTMIITLLSNNDYTRKYELDLLKEMYGENKKKVLVTLDMKNSDEARKNSHYYYTFNNDDNNAEDVFNMFSYIYFAQLFAFYKSKSFGINPDNPCPTGEVNRVVQGVIIYDYKGESQC